MTLPIRSRRRCAAHAPAAAHLSLAAALVGLPPLALAQSDEPTDPTQRALPPGTETRLPAVRVEGAREEPYRIDTSASPKLGQPLVDTPRTVQVIGPGVLQEQGAASLMEALRNTPGITLQMGENGNTSMGDAFQMRGFSAQGSIFVDGMRDVGGISRDLFNTEQVEVVKGASGADIGRGASAGYINQISRMPGLRARNAAELTVGTAARKRLTADLNQPIGAQTAVRLNVMVQDSGVDGRDGVKNRGMGVAPAITFGLGTPTRLTLSGQLLRQNNIPDGGIPAIGLPGYYKAPTATGTYRATAGQAVAITAGAAVDRSNWYGSRDDRERVEAGQFSALIEHDLGSGLQVRSLTRYGRIQLDRVLSGIAPSIAGSDIGDPIQDSSLWTVNLLRQRVAQVNEILANQTLVSGRSDDPWGLRHDWIAGVELQNERQSSAGFGTAAATLRGVAIAAINNPPISLYAPDSSIPREAPYPTGIETAGETTTLAVFVGDTLTVNPAWKFNGGLRLERADTRTSGATLVTAANQADHPGYTDGGVDPYTLRQARNLFSWNVGAVYKPLPQGTVYATLGNALTPPGSANFTLSSSATNANSAQLDPQRTRHVELGTKWEVLQRRLLLNAAVYRTQNANQLTQDPLDGRYVQNGRTRVTGLELSAVGQITPSWQLSAGIARMKTQQLDQLSVAASGDITRTTNVRWSPDLAATLWTAWSHGPVTIGGGVRHLSAQKRVITDSTEPANMPEIPAFTVADAMVSWDVTRDVKLQMNIGNLFDRHYIAELNNSGARVRLGLPRSVSLSARVQF